MAATNIYLGQLVVEEHVVSIAAYERRQVGLLVEVVEASSMWSRFEGDTPLACKGKAVAAL